MEPDDTDSIELIKNNLRSRLQESGISNLIRRMVRDALASRGDMQYVEPEEIIQDLYKKGLMKTVLENLELTGDLEKELEAKIQAQVNTRMSQCHHAHHDNIDDRESSTGGHSPFKEEHDGSPGKSFEDGFGAKCHESHYHQAAAIVEEVPHVKRTKGLLNGKYVLKFEIHGGRSFLDYLVNSEEPEAEENRNFVIHISYKSQRFYTQAVQCQCEPSFNDVFMIDVGYFENGSVLELMMKYEPIRIILLQETRTGERKLLSSHLFDWRSLLMSAKCSEKIPITLMGVGPEFQVPVGTLQTRLSILPHLPEILSASTYAAQVNADKSIQDEKERLFLVYVKQWWREFIEIRPQHSKRFVKIFSYDENTKPRAVQTFVKPVIADRLLLTPFHAAWFVSLIHLIGKSKDDENYRISLKTPVVENGSYPQVLCDHWQSLLSTLTSRAGRVEDHATLLCSLFLGFGLDAYVAVGSKNDGLPWVWVISLDEENHATFWESTTGARFSQYPEDRDMYAEKPGVLRKSHDFRTVSCLFNNTAFYANIQASNFIDVTDWNLLNPSKWKKIPESTLKSSSKYSEVAPELMAPTKLTSLMATDLEVQLKTLISEFRLKHNLHTHWDSLLSRLISQEISRYEIQASMGANKLPSYFQSAVLKNMTGGYEFKGYPWHGKSIDAYKIFHMLFKSSRCEEVIMCRGNDVHLALRVQVYAYPENVISTRVMVACKFIPAG